ncbi:hypothetical protein BJX76DRAFT_357836 [Aspergillus varians]
MPEETPKSTGLFGQQRQGSRLPDDLQELVNKEEQFRFASGDFENSWTSSPIKGDPKTATHPVPDETETQQKANEPKQKTL